MILKVKYPDSAGWIFYDRISRLIVRYAPAFGVLDGWESWDFNARWTSQSAGPGTKYFACAFNDANGVESVLLVEEAYLLSDDGRTVEKL